MGEKMKAMTLFKDVPLRDRLFTVLSAAAKQGQTRVPIKKFYEIFADLKNEFPKVFPDVTFTQTPYYVYSKRLEDALNHWIMYGINIIIPNGHGYFEVTYETAERHLIRMRERYEFDFIDEINLVVAKFIEKTGDLS